VRELQTGLWHWEARHPDWTPEQGWTPKQVGSAGWGPEVSSYAIDDAERLLLFDPLALPSEINELAAGRETTIVLTRAPDARRADGPSGPRARALLTPEPGSRAAELLWKPAVAVRGRLAGRERGVRD
jgi:hypothetical protein